MRPVGSTPPSIAVSSRQPIEAKAEGTGRHLSNQLIIQSDSSVVPERFSLNNRLITVGSFSPLGNSEDKPLLASMFKAQGTVKESSLPDGATLYSYTVSASTQDDRYHVKAKVSSTGQLLHLEGRPVVNTEDKSVLSLEFYARPLHSTGLFSGISQVAENYDLLRKRKFDNNSVDGQAIAKKPFHAKKRTDLTQPMRAAIGNRIQNKMLEQGPEWALEKNAPSTAQGISAKNISSLRQELTPLRNYEKNFLDKFLSTRLYATHATGSGAAGQQGDSVSLFSRKKLQEYGIDFPEGNTEVQDIEDYASDDHVFFSLEAGNTPQKPASRFGQELLRFDFENPAIQKTGILNLVDPATGLPPQATGRFEAIENHPNESEKIHALERLSNVEYSPKESLFHGRHMKAGLGLAIIKSCRDNMPDSIGAKLLSVGTDEYTNHLLNGLFRPSVMVPRHFFGTPVDRATLKPFGFEMEES